MFGHQPLKGNISTKMFLDPYNMEKNPDLVARTLTRATTMESQSPSFSSET
ncbi:hypothetical protein TUM15761_20440 [Neisseria gonorrhoeae]|nr:hypothetical protein TUM15761_20440 [Neisseria gonorrhoeae]